MASTIARNEPEMRMLADLDGEHVASDGEDEQQGDQLPGLPVARFRASDGDDDGRSA